MHIISASQFSLSQLGGLFNRADFFKEQLAAGRGRQLAELHRGRQVCTIFYQPSTRTRLSFETAALKLGFGVVSTENALESSSSSKGESLEDTIRTLNGYGYSAIVIRHNQQGAAKRAAAVSQVPIINAGDGKGEHPTQALYDAYTIYKNLGRLDNLRIVMGGDLKYGRTVRSLSQLLAKYKDNQVTFVSLPEFSLGADIKGALSRVGLKFKETAALRAAVSKADVVYWTRLQTEHLGDDETKNSGFRIDMSIVKSMPKHAIIMHPLPRVDEISTDVDKDPRAKYFEQAANGLYVRMALLDQVASGKL